MSNTGKLVVFSGFSGSGKGTIMKELMAKHGEDYALSVSATTRGPRPGEEHGREYFFISEEEFEQMIKADGLLEYARYVDHYYGTPKSYVNEQLNAGKNVILEMSLRTGSSEEAPRQRRSVHRGFQEHMRSLWA